MSGFYNPIWAETVWAIGLIAWWLIRIPRRRAARRAKVVDDRATPGERAALTFNIVGLAILPILGLATNWFDFADYNFIPWFAVFGTIAMGAFLALFHYSHKQLGKNWSVTLQVRENHGLVKHGLYAKMRHPMYTSFWLWGIAQALLLNNWLYGLAGLASIAWLYFSRIDNEEEMMRQQFGSDYDEYCAKTPRIIPRLF